MHVSLHWNYSNLPANCQALRFESLDQSYLQSSKTSYGNTSDRYSKREQPARSITFDIHNS